MADIKALPDRKAASNAQCIEYLEGLLERARTGVTTHVVVVAYNRDGTTCTGWSAAVDVRPHTVLGSLECVKMEYFNNVVVPASQDM